MHMRFAQNLRLALLAAAIELVHLHIRAFSRTTGEIPRTNSAAAGMISSTTAALNSLNETIEDCKLDAQFDGIDEDFDRADDVEEAHEGEDLENDVEGNDNGVDDDEIPEDGALVCVFRPQDRGGDEALVGLVDVDAGDNGFLNKKDG